MPKLTLAAAPTFKAKVGIPIPGADDAEVEFTFKHRTKADLETWVSAGRDDVAAILDMAEGWDLPDPFNAETVGVLCQNYYGAPEAIIKTYLMELMKARRGN